MRSSVSSLFVLGLTVLGTTVSGCGESPDDDKPTTSGATTTSTTSNGGTGGTGTGGAGGTGGGTTTTTKECSVVEDLKGDINADQTLSADKCYLLKGIVFVNAPAKLTIPAGTKIMGDKTTLGTLVIEPGAQILAKGTKDEPIVFTSQAAPGERAAGDWGGVIVLGNAPINIMGGKANVEGITGDGTEYGGNEPADNSGVIQYVRIEFSGILLSPDNEVNGLTFAGVGSGTTVDHVMVHETLDDCFEFFGGTVNAKHLICANNGDDAFDFDNGYKGKLQFLAVQQDPSVADETNGFEVDNDKDSSLNTPTTEPTVYNVTLCGKNKDVDKQQYGMVLRRSTKGGFHNVIVTGFEAGVDVRDANTSVELTSSIFFGNLIQNVAYPELGADGVEKNDDAGFDEVAWFNDPASKNSEIDPKITDCYGATPDFTPAMTLSTNAATPPNDGFFDAAATYIGAFKAGDTWAEGAWVSYDPN